MKIALIVIGIVLIAGLFILVQDVDSDIQPKTFSVSSSSSGLQPLAVVECSPDSGYDYCGSEQNIFAYAEVQHSYYKGERGFGIIDGENRLYYVKEVYIDVKFEGDYLYASNSPNWPTCTSSGCPWPRISEGKHVVVSAPSKTIPEIAFIAFDKDYSSTGNMYWAWVGIGFYPYDAYVIGCYDESDCGSKEYCDKSGAWDTWSCEIDPCSTMPDPENICDGFDMWAQKCVMGEYVKDYIIETNSNECGCVTLPTPDVCEGYDLWSQKQQTPCVEGLEKDQLIEEKVIECGYVCDEGETKSFKCTDDTTIVTQLCINNEWTDVDIKSCPLNWINLEMILRGHIDNIKGYLEELL